MVAPVGTGQVVLGNHHLRGLAGRPRKQFQIAELGGAAGPAEILGQLVPIRRDHGAAHAIRCGSHRGNRFSRAREHRHQIDEDTPAACIPAVAERMTRGMASRAVVLVRMHHATVRSGALRQTPEELDTGHLLHNPADVFDGSHREAAVDPRSRKGEFRSGCVEANCLRPQLVLARVKRRKCVVALPVGKHGCGETLARRARRNDNAFHRSAVC